MDEKGAFKPEMPQLVLEINEDGIFNVTMGQRKQMIEMMKKKPKGKCK